MFASDNNAPVAPEIMRAIEQANDSDAISYGGDPYTARAIERFREVFGMEADPYLVFNGTGANVIALSCLLKPYEAVIAPASAHLHTDECGALERFAGCKILPVPSSNGKLDVEALRPYAQRPPDPHFVQPRVISISQSTEFGTLYTLAEVEELCEFAHGQGWYVHMDGARISNAAVALKAGLRECTRDLGVDVLTFGGTKNGMMYGEAIIFFDESLHRGAAMFARKQGMHLSSKMRFIAAQFLALLEDDRWMRYASQANEMARRLEMRVRAIAGVRVTRPAECNAVFATLDRAAISKLQEQYFFYIFDDALPEVRWMTHHATRPQDVDAFAQAIMREAAAPVG